MKVRDIAKLPRPSDSPAWSPPWKLA